MKIKLKNPNELKKMLVINGLSQTEFAKNIDITLPYFNKIVNEERCPSPKIAKKIATHLNVEFNDIFFIDDV